MERAAKLEFASSTWKDEAQPIYHARKNGPRWHNRNAKPFPYQGNALPPELIGDGTG